MGKSRPVTDVRPWPARATWLVLPFAAGPALADALEPRADRRAGRRHGAVVGRMGHRAGGCPRAAHGEPHRPSHARSGGAGGRRMGGAERRGRDHLRCRGAGRRGAGGGRRLLPVHRRRLRRRFVLRPRTSPRPAGTELPAARPDRVELAGRGGRHHRRSPPAGGAAVGGRRAGAGDRRAPGQGRAPVAAPAGPAMDRVRAGRPRGARPDRPTGAHAVPTQEHQPARTRAARQHGPRPHSGLTGPGPAARPRRTHLDARPPGGPPHRDGGGRVADVHAHPPGGAARGGQPVVASGSARTA